ncbi:MAG: glucosaminidase domain-containing protein [Bacteroidota bacterium]
MKNKKHDIPMFVIDTRSNVWQKPEEEPVQSPAPQKELQAREQFSPLLELIAQRLIMNIQRSLQMLWDYCSERVTTAVQLRRIPWFKIGLILFAGFVLLKKDMHFNLSFKAPLGEVADDDQISQNSMVQTTALSGRKNPYAPVSSQDLREKQARAFIKEHADVAVKQMHQYGVPASIKMAQALIESRAGRSMLAKKNNNFFGIKCFSKKCAKGHCTNAYDDHHKDFFRKYASPSDSWTAHSRLLTNGRYKKLKQHKKDYKKWAEGLKKAGYATDARYDRKLISVIEKYQLYKLDKR